MLTTAMSHKYPIAEEFHSLQGEGLYTGTAMKFIRLAGCNVGKLKGFEGGQSAVLPNENYIAECTLYDGRKFACDTNYQSHYQKTAIELLQDCWEQHICLTGGEPVLHDCRELLLLAQMNNKIVHIETSGTRYPLWLREMLDSPRAPFWVAVSPKWSPEREGASGLYMELIERAHEIKLLVDKDFTIPSWTIGKHTLVYIQPVNYEKEINKDNLQICYELVKQFPTWRISFQAHKLIDWR